MGFKPTAILARKVKHKTKSRPDPVLPSPVQRVVVYFKSPKISLSKRADRCEENEVSYILNKNEKCRHNCHQALGQVLLFDSQKVKYALPDSQ